MTKTIFSAVMLLIGVSAFGQQCDQYSKQLTDLKKEERKVRLSLNDDYETAKERAPKLDRLYELQLEIEEVRQKMLDCYTAEGVIVTNERMNEVYPAGLSLPLIYFSDELYLTDFSQPDVGYNLPLPRLHLQLDNGNRLILGANFFKFGSGTWGAKGSSFTLGKEYASVDPSLYYVATATLGTASFGGNRDFAVGGAIGVSKHYNNFFVIPTVDYSDANGLSGKIAIGFTFK